uniref:REC8 meiotic recombination protein n=1 Tax=Rousettus aegyptiacus TaxID=9407 RepID=A0A7J8ISW5_ROUAE|nr:REC8 meiotic recombination protein [Rousettus aegyptiacus]
MFYYPNVLQRHTGCFATIWLAATRGSRLVKREYLKVNVVKTCEEILNYLLVRVQPPQPGLPRPRFSLYLSAQLQIGVIRVYSQQCQYLVEDIQHILERLHRVQLQIRIDMVETDLPSLLLPNHLALMETLEDAPDPFFGIMSVGPRLPSPFNIPQIRHLLEAVTPERVPEEAPPEVPTEPGKPVRPLVTVISPEAITLQEAEPIRMLEIEGERDLPEVSRRDLDLLIAEEDEAILLEERVSKEEPRAPEMEITVPPLSPIALAQVEVAAEPLPGPVLAPEELKPAVWEPEALLAEVTPPEELRLPAPLSPERRPPISPPARRRRRRRQLLFWDKETQISREQFQKQLYTRAHCWECPMVQPPERTIRSPTELFQTPTYSGWLSPELLALWTHCAQPPPRALRRMPPLVPELPEVPMEIPLELPPEPELLSLEAVHRAVALELQANREPDFNSLVSPLSPRRVAARVFYLLLVLAMQQILRIEQEKPYGRLLIQPGPRFHSS